MSGWNAMADIHNEEEEIELPNPSRATAITPRLKRSRSPSAPTEPGQLIFKRVRLPSASSLDIISCDLASSESFSDSSTPSTSQNSSSHSSLYSKFVDDNAFTSHKFHVTHHQSEEKDSASTCNQLQAGHLSTTPSFDPVPKSGRDLLQRLINLNRLLDEPIRVPQWRPVGPDISLTLEKEGTNNSLSSGKEEIQPSTSKPGISRRMSTHKLPSVSKSLSVPSLSILSKCTLFVDVWMMDRQETSDLFAEIARELGATTAKKFGPQCTHIVFTSGRPKTVQKYFALKAHERPKVVGAAWIRDCRKSGKRLDEERYLVDMDEYRSQIESPGKIKLKRRYIPKFIGESDDMVELPSSKDDEPPIKTARLRFKHKGRISQHARK